jgi:hypothetical protein
MELRESLLTARCHGRALSSLMLVVLIILAALTCLVALDGGRAGGDD